ncbi:SDR family NAD(P)-dependent oxidoreductase [Oceanobacillus alkalisoli]|uniref:SDR family NAD(P)-dependent oxidoreductase n=1 Tax=Oceanobacillus alkalisoli TaxID=2925113 RepID=UPI001F11C03E|nr:SDR family oxidoreductase [Oceanobacillus alkalisoli]MCF3942593.1 SDR family oxidoreductase [Oceanobacillus alkalisoli]
MVLFDSIKGANVLITGGSKGIGKTTATYFTQLGANVAVVARNPETLSETVDDLKKVNNDTIGIQGDVSSIEDIKRIVEETESKLGDIDVLVNCAGVNIPKPVLEVTEEDWDTIHNINLKGAFFLSQAVANRMKNRNRGKIINLSSQMGHVGYYDRGAYCASKGGLELANKVLALELAPCNIQVNTVCPTFIETPLTEGYFKDEKFKEAVLNKIPLGRLGETKDVVGAILYLASDLSNLVTGTALKVDGGWTAW